MKSKTIPRMVYDFFIKRWFLTILFLTISSHWFVFVQIFGKGLNLIDTAGKLTKLAHGITWPLFSISLIFAISKSLADKYNEQAKNNGQYVLERMLQSVNAVTSAKMQRFCEYIERNHGITNLQTFRDITQPKQQSERLLENIQITLSEIFGINRDDIGLSVVYKSDVDDTWAWLCKMNTDGELDIDTLFKDPHTTIRQLIDTKKKSMFLPDKRIGVQQQKYVAGPKDASYNTIGSIICRDISIGQDNKYMRAILSITTYGKQLCEYNDKDAIDKIENLVISAFEKRLQLELALLYAKESMNPKCVNCVA